MKKIIRIFSLVFVIVMTCIILVGCEASNIDDNISQLKIVDVEEKGIGLKMTRLAVTSKDSSIISSVKITATVSPSNATNKKLSWDLSWKTSSSDNVNQYVVATLSSDTLTCTVYYLRPFEKSILLTVSSVSNPDVTSSCTFDCYKKEMISCAVGVDLNGANRSIVSNYPSNVIDYTDLKTLVSDDLEYCTFDSTMTEYRVDLVGTVNFSESISTYDNVKYVIYLTDDLKNVLSSYNFTCKDDFGIEINDNLNDSFMEMFNEYCDANSNLEDFYLALFEIPEWFELRLMDDLDVLATFNLKFAFENEN